MSMRPLALGSVGLALLLLAGCGAEPSETAEPATAAAPPGPTTSEAPDSEKSPPALGDVRISITPERDPGLEAVHRYTRMFYGGELEQLFEKFSPEMRQEILPLDKLRQLREFVRKNYGKEVEVVGEDSRTQGDYRGFVRWARFSDHDGVIEIQWILRPDDTVAGLLVRPAKRKQAG